MNGLSLLVALATVGINVDWETTASGTRAYTIRLESVVIDTLLDGSAVESVVLQRDRGLRKFRVAVGPQNLQTEQRAATTANEVDYGWRPNESNSIDYYVQISLERLETLARGIPLECEVHPDVPEIDKIFVFVGDTKLPRELPLEARTSAATPRDLSSIGNARGGNVAPVSGTENNIETPRYGSGAYGTQSNTQVAVSGASRSNGYDTQGSSPAGRYDLAGNSTLPAPQLNNSSWPANDRNRAPIYDYNREQYAPRQETVARPSAPQTQPSYQHPATQVATRPQQPPYTQVQAPAAPYAVQQTYPVSGPANPLAMDPYTAALSLQKADLEKSLENVKREKADAETEKAALAKQLEEKERSPKSLILTTLALFASIGANAYLGWLAWSFFWRFRDAASDLSRARSNAFPSPSIVGH